MSQYCKGPIPVFFACLFGDSIQKQISKHPMSLFMVNVKAMLTKLASKFNIYKKALQEDEQSLSNTCDILKSEKFLSLLL